MWMTSVAGEKIGSCLIYSKRNVWRDLNGFGPQLIYVVQYNWQVYVTNQKQSSAPFWENAAM